METKELICALDACADAYIVNIWFGGLTAIAAILAVVAAWYQLAGGRHEEAVRATYKAIEFEASSAEWIAMRNKYSSTINSLDRDPELILEHVRALRHGGQDAEDVYVLRAILNRYEYVGILLKSGGGDLNTYLLWFANTIVVDWDLLRPVVHFIRQDAQNSRLFETFEWLKNQAVRRKH